MSPGRRDARPDVCPLFPLFHAGGRPIHIGALVASEDSLKSNRPRLTLEPLSADTGMMINQPCPDRAVGELVAWLKQRPPHQIMLVSWHHTRMAKLLTSLGADPAAFLPDGRWPYNAFDWVVALRFDRDGSTDHRRFARHPRTCCSGRPGVVGYEPSNNPSAGAGSEAPLTARHLTAAWRGEDRSPSLAQRLSPMTHQMRQRAPASVSVPRLTPRRCNPPIQGRLAQGVEPLPMPPRPLDLRRPKPHWHRSLQVRWPLGEPICVRSRRVPMPSAGARTGPGIHGPSSSIAAGVQVVDCLESDERRADDLQTHGERLTQSRSRVGVLPTPTMYC